jgi:hypothetical protein
MNSMISLEEPPSRRGKIARLPRHIREELNRRLQNGEEARKALQWLNSLPEVQSVLAADFDGQPINDQNISNWKYGGYRDWEAKEDVLEVVRAFTADAPEFQQGGGPSFSENLALRLAAQAALLLRRLTADDNSPSQLESLAKLCRQVVELRRGDHDAQWLQLGRERLALDLQKFQAQVARADRAVPKMLDSVTRDDFRIIEETDNLL